MNSKGILLTVLSGTCFMFFNCATFLSFKKPVGQYSQKLVVESVLDYLLYIPDEYNENQQDWPLLLFLHGAGERGSVIDSVKKHGPPKLVEQIPNMPFIIVSPQCPEEEWWTNKISELDELLNYICAKYRVDEKKIYVTGLSMGGYGTWELATAYPNRFAAIAPICGGGDSRRICRIKDVPIWVFHGAQDKTVPIERSQELVDALEKCGGNVKFMVYPEAGHDSWTETYKNPDLYKWFLEQALIRR